MNKGLKSIRPLTEQEIKEFGIMPEGAIRYDDYPAYLKACRKLSGIYQTGCDIETGLFWTKEVSK